MSLVGSLEDLGLADILQIVSLSRKSGTLMLRSESGSGRILLHDGLVRGAVVKGEVEDLRGLLIAEGCVDGEAFDRARETARSEALALDEVLGRICGLASERLAALRREHVERSVMRMFDWRAGEFSFEIRESLPDGEEAGLLLSSGLNTQYLAMEATRRGDEQGPTDGSESEDDAMMFSGETTGAGSATEALAAAAVREVAGAIESPDESEPVDAPPPPVDARGSRDGTDAVCEVAIDAARVGETRVPVSVEAQSPSGPRGVLVAVDADLSSLEWVKASVGEMFGRTHIFQRRDAALVRIRQYLVRGTQPLVLMADGPADRRGPDAERFADRLRGLAPAMPILLLHDKAGSPSLPPHVDGALRRPASLSADPDRWHLHEAIAERLRSDLAAWLAGERAPAAGGRAGERG